MSTVVKDLGAVSAYAYAVEKGYTGTEEEFAELMADYANVGQRAEDAAGSAMESKTAAQTAATTATTKASEAATSAQTATTKAGEATTAADTATTAKNDAVSAKNAAETAQGKAETAQGKAETAQGKAEDSADEIASSAAQIAQNTSDISELKSDLNAVEDEFLNAIYKDGDPVTIQKNTDSAFSLNSPSGYIHVKSTDNPIYTGTVNVIDLIGLKQGTFVDSTSGVTIEISGNEIYIHGTTTRGFRFNPQTGEFYTDSFANHPADFSNIPNDHAKYTLCWWEKDTYTLSRSIYIASLDSSGNISPTNLQGHVKTFYPDTPNQYITIYSNGALNNLDSKFTIGFKINALTASEGASIEQVAKSDYNTIVITTSGYYDLDVFTWTGADTIYDIVSTMTLLKPNPLTDGHVYAWFGDSLSQLKELPNLVASMLEVTVHDCTFAGAPLTYGDPTKYQPTGFMSLCSQIVAGDFTPLSDALDAQEAAGTNVTEKRQHLATLEALDFNTVTDIVLLAGTNDFDNDHVNATKFVSGFSGALTTLLTEYPHLIVYVIAPPWRGDKTEGVTTIPTMEDLVELEKGVADGFSLPWYDLYHRSGINSLTATVYLTNDLLHPSDAGDALLANKCAKFLQSN